MTELRDVWPSQETIDRWLRGIFEYTNNPDGLLPTDEADAAIDELLTFLRDRLPALLANAEALEWLCTQNADVQFFPERRIPEMHVDVTLPHALPKILHVTGGSISECVRKLRESASEEGK